MATQVSARRASLASTASTATTSSRTSTESFLDLVKITLEAAASVQRVNRQVNIAISTQGASDRLCAEVISMLYQCSECLIRPNQAQRNGWAPALSSAQARSTKTATKAQSRKDLSSSLLAYINNQVASARRQGIRLDALTIVTNDLSVRQLRRLPSVSQNTKLGSGIRVFSTAISTWEIRVGPSFKIHLVHSQLRRVATRLKSNLAVTLEKVSKQIIAQGGKSDANARNLTDLYLLRAYFGTQLWLHGQQRGPSRTETSKKKAWYEVAAVSFIEPYINACPKAKAAAQLGRRIVSEIGMGGGGDEECELALVNEVLLQVVSPFSGIAA